MGGCISRAETSSDTRPRVAWAGKTGDTLSVVPVQQAPVVVNVPPREPYSGSLLVSAATEDDLEMVKRILAKGVEKAWTNKAFYEAVRNGKLYTAAYLGLNGADVNFQDSVALMAAAHSGNLNMVKLLVSLGVDTHARKGNALISAIAEHHVEVTRYLVTRVNVNRYLLLLELTEHLCRHKCDAWKLACDLHLKSKETYDLGDGEMLRLVANYL